MLARVETCADAKLFTEARNDWELNHPSERVFGELPSPAANRARDNEEFDGQHGDLTTGSLPDLASIRSIEPKVADGFVTLIQHNVLHKRPLGGGVYEMCSPFLIGRNAFLTAAHCIPGNDVMYYGELSQGDGLPCINAYCGQAGANLWGFRFPGYTGTGDWGRDFGIVFGLANWLAPANVDTHWIRLLDQHTALGEQFFVEGYGWTASSGGSVGTGRRGNFFEIIEENPASWWSMTVSPSKGRPCKGDSGSPADNRGLLGKAPAFAPAAIGVWSGFSYDPVFGQPLCPDLGYRAYYSRISDKLDWIEPIRATFGLGPCYQGTSNGNYYRRCW